MRKIDAKKIEANRWANITDKNKNKISVKQEISSIIQDNREGLRKVTVIQPKGKIISDKKSKKIKVAAYCRVSTAEEAQMNSFEMQVHHFNRIITENPNYHLVKIYKDEGISGTSIRNRTGFVSMMEDAKSGKIELILTKSISRFGRNIVDVLTALRELSNMSPPVSVYFETEGIGTSDGQNSLIISILSALAEMESQMKSEAVKAGIQYRMSEGIYKFGTSNLLGYYRDYTGCVKIEKNESEIVNFIYDSFLSGATFSNIATNLTNLGILSPAGKQEWVPSTIKSILTNEKYCGNVIFQKTYTKDFRTHQSVVNKGILTQWKWEDIIPAIIPLSKWELTQQLINDASLRPKAKPFRPPKPVSIVTRIKSGPLSGFYLLDMQWKSETREKSPLTNHIKGDNIIPYSQ